MDRRFSLVFLFLVVAALGVTGCVGAPEHCRGCLAVLADAGAYVPPRVDGGAGMGMGGAIVATGGRIGSGGMVGTGGSASGGNVGSGGATGGSGTGGAATGGTGTGGTATGGVGTGGAATGGMGTGGAATGGMGTGGAATGGRGTGGAATGGMGTGGAATGGRGTGGAADPDLVLWYKFDETTGTAADSSGNGRAGTPTGIGTGGMATYSTTSRVPPGSLNLTSTSPTVGGYLVVPAGLNAMGATTAITIAAWVQVRTGRNWQRVFDFGNGSSTTSSYAFLTTQQGASTPNSPRFAISTTGNMNEQLINMTTPAVLSTGAWHHMAVVLGTGSTYTGTLYIDKVAVGMNAAMTIRPSALGATTNNWIGRSQYMTADPLFDGLIDDFRIYRRALTAAEITALP